MNKPYPLRFLSAALAAFMIMNLTVQAASEAPLTNDSIVELQGLNLGDAVIIEKIKTSKCNFDTSIDGLKKLKAAKVSSAVIQAMLATKSPAAASTVSDANINVNDPLAMHSAGVWVLQEAGGKKTMSKVDYYQPQFASKGSGYNPWSGVTVEQFVYLPGLKAKIQLSARRPVFYFYFVNGRQLATQGGSFEFMNLQSPDEFMLIRFQTKDGRRELTTSKGNGWYYSKNMDKSTRGFDAEKVAEGIYKITTKKDLMNGEYAFSAAPEEGHGQCFPFGIVSTEPYHFPTTITDPEIIALCETLKSSKPNEVIKALKTLREKDAPEAVEQILPCLKNSNSNVKRDACRTLAVLGDSSIIPYIEPLLKDSRKDVIKDAQDAIDQLKPKS
jgi:hypothetical protein